MVQTCVAYGCSERFQIGSDLRFFRIPQNEKKRKAWIRVLKRKNWQPTASSRICSKHFQLGKPSKDPKHPDYLPNVFAFTKNTNSALLYERRCRTIEKKRLAVTCSEQLAEEVSLAEEIIEISENVSQVTTDSTAIAENTFEVATESTAFKENTSEVTTGFLEFSENTYQEVDVPFGVLEENDGLVLPPESCSKLLLKIMELHAQMEEMKKEISSLKSERDSIKSTCEHLNSEVIALREERDDFKDKGRSFSEKIVSNDIMLKYYTTLNSPCFQYILKCMSPCVQNKIQTVLLETQLLIVLTKLKHNLKYVDLAYRFETSSTTVSRIFKLWIPRLGTKLKSLIFWPEKRAIKQNLPACFKKSLFKDTRVIIDCTEVRMQKAGNQTARSQTWSNYKHHHTVKFLVGITPNGQFCFVSESFGGRISDKEITLKSRFLAHIESGDIVMADRGFIMPDYFTVKGAKLVIPSLLGSKKQLTLPEVMHSKNVSNVRIHVERAIKMIKRFDILHSVIPITLVKYINSIVVICAALSNLSKPIVN